MTAVKDSVRLMRAELSDGRTLYEMQVVCFRPLLEKYQDHEVSPAAEKPEKTLMRLREPFTDFYFILLGDRKIGALRVRHLEERCRLGPIFLLPEYQGRGYAQEAVRQAEARYPDAALWELDTILQEEKLCYLYEKLGYRRTGKTERIKEGMDLVFFEKQIKKEGKR